jgi:probable O-glycosylation ligase (exosortase A-associated)
MRDIVVVSVVIAGCLMSLRRPWIGVLVWVWLSIMNPHRYTYGFAYDAPLNQITVVCFFIGLLMTKDRYKVFAGAPIVWLLLLCIWMTLSMLFGVDPASDYDQWVKVLKIFLMVFMALAVMRSREHILALTWVLALSLGLLGAKGGVFTISSGGSNHVLGPPGSLISDNNEFALALVMTIPLLRFLQQQLDTHRGRQLLTVMMVLCGAAALGSQSRGGLLAITAMVSMMWWRGGSRLGGGIMIAAVAFVLLGFMPDEWTQRMNSIGDYQDDRSSMNRISAWWTAWGVAKDYPFGAGFHVARPILFERYSPYPENGVWAAHSIYFQMMGSHGFVGLGLFLAVFVSAWRVASRVQRASRGQSHLLWCSQLAVMCQVSLLGYAAGGAFLSLAYFDFPYYVVVLIVLTDLWVRRRAWETEPNKSSMRWTLPGLLKGVVS